MKIFNKEQIDKQRISNNQFNFEKTNTYNESNEITLDNWTEIKNNFEKTKFAQKKNVEIKNDKSVTNDESMIYDKKNN